MNLTEIKYQVTQYQRCEYFSKTKLNVDILVYNCMKKINLESVHHTVLKKRQHNSGRTRPVALLFSPRILPDHRSCGDSHSFEGSRHVNLFNRPLHSLSRITSGFMKLIFYSEKRAGNCKPLSIQCHQS